VVMNIAAELGRVPCFVDARLHRKTSLHPKWQSIPDGLRRYWPSVSSPSFTLLLAVSV
jgi:hypothetical protein